MQLEEKTSTSEFRPGRIGERTEAERWPKPNGHLFVGIVLDRKYKQETRFGEKDLVVVDLADFTEDKLYKDQYIWESAMYDGFIELEVGEFLVAKVEWSDGDNPAKYAVEVSDDVQAAILGWMGHNCHHDENGHVRFNDTVTFSDTDDDGEPF